MNWKLLHSSGEIYQAEFSLLSPADLPRIKKNEGWSRGFNWAKYLSPVSEFIAYKLHLVGNPQIQGLLAVAVRDGFAELDLIEKAPSNRIPINEFMNVGEVLFAKACLISFEHKGNGYVLLRAKTNLIEHYMKRYGMEIIHLKKRLLAIPPLEAQRLIRLYLIKRS